MNIDHLVEILARKIDEKRLIRDVAMGQYTSFKTGGRASLLVIPDDIAQLQYALHTVEEMGVPFYIMGNGTNILVKDAGYQGIIVKIGEALSKIEVTGRRIKAEAGTLLKDVSKVALDNNLAGFEFASGIPGSIGGAAFMNAGAYDGDMSGVVESVRVLNIDSGEITELTSEQMEYAYRKSRLMDESGIILSVTLKLNYGSGDEIALKITDFKRRREAKQPLNFPSAGSFFKRPAGNFAGTLIEKAGFKGRRIGGAMVSELHAGFIINTGDATAKDIIALMEAIQYGVYKMSKIRLEPEIRIIGEDRF